MRARFKKTVRCLAILMPAGILSGCSLFSGQAGSVQVEPKDIDPWVYLTDTAVSQNSTMQAFAGSAAELLITIGVLGIVFSIFFLIIRLLFGSGNARLKSEMKEEVMFKSLVAVMLFSIPFWLGIIKMISDLLV